MKSRPVKVCADVQVLPESHSRLYFSFQAIAAMSRLYLWEREMASAVRAVRLLPSMLFETDGAGVLRRRYGVTS